MTPGGTPLAQFQWISDSHIQMHSQILHLGVSWTLQINMKKSECLSFFLCKAALPILLYLVKSNSICPVAQAINLGVIFDSSVSLSHSSLTHQEIMLTLP